MNVADYLRRQFLYDAWANQETWKAIRSAGDENRRSVHLMSHILAAERVWLQRLRQTPQSVPVWPEPDLAWCEGEATTLGQEWLAYLGEVGERDVSKTISYKNTKGELWTSAIVDVLLHVSMHSTYHRGQIASHMRACGQTPPYTDFIHAIRQGFVK